MYVYVMAFSPPLSLSVWNWSRVSFRRYKVDTIIILCSNTYMIYEGDSLGSREEGVASPPALFPI